MTLRNEGRSVSLTLKASEKITEANISASLWKKIFSIAGASGGTVYWRAVGKREDKTEYVSETHSIIVDPAQPVGNPNISDTRKGSLPILSWQSNCSTRFKVWFGSDNAFSEKKVFTFHARHPVES